MNYVELNGVKSTTIQGLLIQTLPPISKPRQRTRVEEIDGRDGDIIYSLGYSAYDKEFSIGLHGTYDVDQVIAFFNSSGTVTFSNEPEKYYRYEITDQIDFERLLRWKQAKVKMHVQPFKYKVGEETTGTGNITLVNEGNIYSRPRITVHGSGIVDMSLNGSQILSLNIGDSEYITIDAEEMNAYQGTALANRRVTGDYDALRLNVGSNSLTFSGAVTEVFCELYSRWL